MKLELIIKIENLGKKYMIGAKEPYYSLRDSLVNIFKKKPNKKEFWALKNINLEIKKGEILGIIGPNGAGKSTLLKIISRITPPTTGQASISGRVASLLEIGTGFHPELTGRENIFLSAAILGMSRQETKEKFDQIVEFSEISQFLDTPVKRYSSGMYVRLAFSIAAHIDPDILIIDEVLAVGDANFQKKCLGKMGEASHDGRTVLLVSHNMHSILSLSTRCVLLSKGKVVKIGRPEDVVRVYQKDISNDSSGKTDLVNAEHYGDQSARFTSLDVRTKDGSPLFATGCDMEIEVVINANEDISNADVQTIIYDENYNRLIDANTLTKGYVLDLKKNHQAKIVFSLDKVLLKEGTYFVGIWMGSFANHEIDAVLYATSFKMEARREDTLYASPYPGVYVCEYKYQVQKNQIKNFNKK